MIRTNHFKLEFTDESIYQYSVKITTDIHSVTVLIGKLKWEIIKKIKAELGNFLGGKSLAYNAGKNCIYIAGLLPFDSRTFIISLDDSEDNAMPTEKFTVYIKKWMSRFLTSEVIFGWRAQQDSW